MKTTNVARKANSAPTLNLWSRVLLCIAFLSPLWSQAQQTSLRQKPKAPPAQIGQASAAQQAPNQTSAQAAPRQGASQTGTQAASTPVAVDATRASTPPVSAQKQLPPAKTLNDVFSDRLGGMVFSSGTEDIHLTILPHSVGPHSPREKLWTDARTPFNSGIYPVSPGPERFIGYNIPGGVTVNLGKIPASEIIFAIKTFDGFLFRTGGTNRNPDNLVHAFTRTFLSGQVEVWFEDSAGTINTGRCDRDMDDIGFRLTGCVLGNGQIAELLKAGNEQAADKRDLQPAQAGAKP